ncbi:hypothetical protein RN2511_035910 [Rhodococcus sp. NKCM2511]|uniref:hypothetical protein n=1 Tax=Rhodococcus sp. NKCM2511 TaxID=2766011 RepID=UPI0019109C5A|nr:hypothetical protein [Rhodococcus sp. NKCM2511]GHP18855.1 hypothetical protein RN2511_035910 [Rhodococcus sp. NKCM2511]
MAEARAVIGTPQELSRLLPALGGDKAISYERVRYLAKTNVSLRGRQWTESTASISVKCSTLTDFLPRLRAILEGSHALRETSMTQTDYQMVLISFSIGVSGDFE